MDTNEFDGIVARLASSSGRRTVIGSLAVAGLGLFAGAASTDAKKRKKRKGKKGKKKNVVSPNGGDQTTPPPDGGEEPYEPQCIEAGQPCEDKRDCCVSSWCEVVENEESEYYDSYYYEQEVSVCVTRPLGTKGDPCGGAYDPECGPWEDPKTYETVNLTCRLDGKKKDDGQTYCLQPLRQEGETCGNDYLDCSEGLICPYGTCVSDCTGAPCTVDGYVGCCGDFTCVANYEYSNDGTCQLDYGVS